MSEWTSNFDVTGVKRTIPADEEEMIVDGFQSFVAGVKRHNWANTAISNAIDGGRKEFADDPNYIALEDPANQYYNPHQMVWANSAEEAEFIRGQIDYEMKQLEVINASSWGLVGEIFGSMFRPDIFLGGGAGLARSIATQTGLEIGSEAYLHAEQKTRTAEESLINIGGVTASNLLLQGVPRLAKGWKTPSWKSDNPELDDLGQGDNFKDSAGAAAVPGRPADDRLSGGRWAEVLAVGPHQRVMRSESDAARELNARLSDSSMYTKGMETGETHGVTIESEARVRAGEVQSVLDTFRKLQREHVKEFHGGMVDRLVTGRTAREFDEQVGVALSNGGKHNDPRVAEAAAAIRTGILEPRKQELIDAGFDIKKAKYATDYFPRVYDRRAILKNYKALKYDLENHFGKVIKKERSAAAKEKGGARLEQVTGRLAEAEKKLAKLEAAKNVDKRAVARAKASVSRYTKIKKELMARPKKPTPKMVKERAARVTRDQQRETAEIKAESAKRAKDTIQNMLGGLPTGHGISALNARTLSMTDKMLEPYLEKRASLVMAKYTSSLDPYLIMKKHFGDENLPDQFAKIEKEYADLIDEAGKAGDAKRAESLKAQRVDVIADLEHIKNRILNRVQRSLDPSNTAERIIQYTKTYNIATQLLGVTLTSAADLARPIMATSLRSFMKGVHRGWGDYIDSLKGMSNQEIRRFGVAMQRVDNDRLMQMADLEDPVTSGTAVMNSLWGKLTGFNHWTDLMESIAAHASMDYTLRMAEKVHSGALLSRAETMKIARMGFTNDDLMAFRSAAKKTGGQDDKALKYANTLEWDDIELAKKFAAGIGSDVHRTIVRVGAGDKPRKMDDPLVSLIFQYQSFAIAATNRMLVAGLQQRDMAMLSGMLVSVLVGMGVGTSKSILGGKDPSKWSADQLLREGIDRTGTLGIYNHAFNLMRNYAGDSPSRYAHRGMLGTLGGSTLSQGERAFQATNSALEGDLEKAGEKAIRLIPFHDPMHMRTLAKRLYEEM